MLQVCLICDHERISSDQFRGVNYPTENVVGFADTLSGMVQYFSHRDCDRVELPRMMFIYSN